jgi:hypothetical protein
MSIYYNVPTTKENTRIPVEFECTETNDALNYTINLVHKQGEEELYLENKQYLSLDVVYQGTSFIVNGTKLYLTYSG